MCQSPAPWTAPAGQTTAIGTDEHLHRYIVYIDLNMVRAGVVEHPAQWLASGYREIQKPPKRYAVIDRQTLIESCGLTDVNEFQRAHQRWIEEALARELTRAAHCSEAIAVESPGRHAGR